MTAEQHTQTAERQRLEERSMQLVQQVANLRSDLDKKTASLQASKAAVVQLTKDNQDLTVRVQDLTYV